MAEKLQWRRAGDEEEALRRSQFSLALGSRGFSARLMIIGEILIEAADSPIGRLLVASAAVTGAWILL